MDKNKDYIDPRKCKPNMNCDDINNKKKPLSDIIVEVVGFLVGAAITGGAALVLFKLFF